MMLGILCRAWGKDLSAVKHVHDEVLVWQVSTLQEGILLHAASRTLPGIKERALAASRHFVLYGTCFDAD